MRQIAPPFISQKTFDWLKLKEKAYINFLYEKKYTRKQIMKKLYIDNDRSFRRLQNKMSNVIKADKMTKN